MDLYKLPEAVTGPIYKEKFFVLPKEIQDFIINLSSPIKFRSLNTLCNYYVTGLPRQYIGDYTRGIQPAHQKFFKKYKKHNLEISQLEEVRNFILSNLELRISLDKVSLNDIIYISKAKPIKRLIINERFDNNHVNLARIKEKLLMFIKRNDHIKKLSVFESCFDAECARKISEKGVITTLCIRKYMSSGFNDDFYQALTKISQLKKLELITSATSQQVTTLTNHPSLEHLVIIPEDINYDQALLFLKMPKLKYFYSLTKDLTIEQEQKLKEIAESRSINLQLHEAPKKL